MQTIVLGTVAVLMTGNYGARPHISYSKKGPALELELQNKVAWEMTFPDFHYPSPPPFEAIIHSSDLEI